jgi:hypothetical protein
MEYRIMKIIGILLLTSFVLSGCTSGGSIRSENARIGNQYYSPTNYVDVYFGRYSGGRAYEQISFIQVLGGERSKTDDLIKELRREAKSIGADAIIDVRKGSSMREEIDGALLFLSIAAREDSSKASSEYRSDTLEGIAIKYLD